MNESSDVSQSGNNNPAVIIASTIVGLVLFIITITIVAIVIFFFLVKSRKRLASVRDKSNRYFSVLIEAILFAENW